MCALHIYASVLQAASSPEPAKKAAQLAFLQYKHARRSINRVMRWALPLLLLRSARSLRTPHPLLSSAAAHAYRAQAGREFARVAPLIKAPLLQDSNKTEDVAAGKVLLKKMDRALQTPADLTTVARRGYIRTVYDD